MDPYRNPFAPGAGFPPPELAGRDDILKAAQISCGRALYGRNARSSIMLGLRGVGKTVLLNEIEKIATHQGFLVTKIESPEKHSLPHLLYPQLSKVLRSLSVSEAAKSTAKKGLRALRSFAAIFKIKIGEVEIDIEPEHGIADTGDLQHDLPALFQLIGDAAKAANKGWLLLIDEVQYLNEEDLSALIISIHKSAQNQLPIFMVGAGLPQVARLAGEAKSYAERLFQYPHVGPLTSEAAAYAITKPLIDEDASITQNALDFIIEQTSGYPFYIQEYASFVWDIAEGPEINLTDAKNAAAKTVASLDMGFFKVRIDQLTPSEIKFVEAMAQLGSSPYAMSDLANSMKRAQTSLAPIRASIIRKGIIYSPGTGKIDFTVPLFADYLNRQ